jgi:hypothetical protein
MRQRLLVLAMVCAGLLQVGAVPAQEAAASRDYVASPPRAIAEIEIVAPDDATLALLGELDIELAQGSEGMTCVVDEGQLAALDAAGVEFSVLRRGVKLKGSLSAPSSGPGTSVGDAALAERSMPGLLADCAGVCAEHNEDLPIEGGGWTSSTIQVSGAPVGAVVASSSDCSGSYLIWDFAGGPGGAIGDYLQVDLVHAGIRETIIPYGYLTDVVSTGGSAEPSAFAGSEVNGPWRLDLLYTCPGDGVYLDGWALCLRYVAQCTDPYEPNETFGSAIPVSPGAIYPFICDENDVDFFKFTAAAGQEISLYLEYMPENYDMSLISPLGTLLRSSITGGTFPESILWTAAVTGDYRVKVWPAAGAKGDVLDSYRLEVELTSPSCPDAYEPNDAFSSALAVTDGNTFGS